VNELLKTDCRHLVTYEVLVDGAWCRRVYTTDDREHALDTLATLQALAEARDVQPPMRGVVAAISAGL
jgi:hypothetical protein